MWDRDGNRRDRARETARNSIDSTGIWLLHANFLLLFLACSLIVRWATNLLTQRWTNTVPGAFHGRLYNICASQPANHIERRAHTHNLCLQFAFSSAQPVSVLLHRFALDPGKSIFVRFPSARPSRRRFTIAQSLQNVQQSIPCHKIKKKDMKPRGVIRTLPP